MKGPKQKIFAGDVFKTNFGGDCTVVEYNGSQNIQVKFEDGTVVKTYSHLLQVGKVRNPNSPRVFGRGFVGIGKYSAGAAGNITKEYNTWSAMLARCYDTKNQPTSYIGCEVAEDWLNFQVFAEWCNNQTGFRLDGWQLDKDLLLEGNKMYGPETCCFLPQQLNNIFRTKRVNKRDRNLPRGVLERDGKFHASSSFDKKAKYLGIHATKESAFDAVRTYVEEKIKFLADLHRENLSSEAYAKLLSFKYKPH